MSRICLPEYECTPKCRSLVHGAQIVSAITRQNDVAVLAYIRSLCCNCSLVHDPLGRTALHMAALCGRKQVLKWLLKHGHANCNIRDWESGWTALHRSIFYGQLTASKLLIENGANLYSPDFEGLTPLDLIVKDRLFYINYTTANPCDVYVWGSNSNFNLGYENQQSKSNPEIVEYFRREKLGIKQVSMSKYHTVFLTVDGQVYSCGHGHGGRLGQDSEQTCIAPKRIKMPSTDECIHIASGMDHTIILSKNGNVWTCGLNTYHQLGHSPPPERLLSPKSIKYLKNHPVKIEGVCAARFHSIVYSADAVFTFGLNGGQLGHLKGERTQITPQQVSSINLRDTAIACVTASDGATVCATDKGDIYVLHEYHCRKIASKQLNIQKVAVIGGHLDSKLNVSVLKEKGGLELTIFILNKSGQVLIWRQSSSQLIKCSFNLKHQLNINDLALNQTSFLLLTVTGEGYSGCLPSKKDIKSASGDTTPSSKKDKKTKDEQSFYNTDNYSNNKKDKKDNLTTDLNRLSLLNSSSVKAGGDTFKTVIESASTFEKGTSYEMFHVKRLFNIHRGILAVSDPKGRNFAVIQAHPSFGILEFPSIDPLKANEHYCSLLETADIYDNIHDIKLQIEQRQFAAHKFILASRVEYFSKMFLLHRSSEEQNTLMKIENVHPEIFAQVLKYIYTNSCDFLKKGFKLPIISVDLEEKISVEAESKKNTNNKSAFSVLKGKKRIVKQKKSVIADPISMLQEAAKKFNINSLVKQLDCIKHTEGIINDSSAVQPVNKLKFDRKKHPHLHDVCIKSEDGFEIWCHRCILTARLEYFHSMLAYGWIETSTNAPLALSFPANILEILINYLYAGDAPDLLTCDDVDLLCQVLIVADQLLVSHLKQICEKSLADHVTLRNAAELLEFSSVYRAKQLQNTCMEFICINLPAILENKNLNVVSEDALDELTEFYRNLIPAMEYRRITPYFDSPQEDEMKSVAENLPHLPEESWKEESINIDNNQSLKKQKLKRKPRSRKSSASETKTSLQYQEPFTTEIISDTELENLDVLEEIINDESILISEKPKPSSPIAIPQRKGHMEDLNLKSPLFYNETYMSEYSSSSELNNTTGIERSPTVPWTNPQLLDDTIDLKQIMTQQQQEQQKSHASDNRSDFKKSVKLSQKQRKKLAAENQAASSPKDSVEEKVPIPINPWAKTTSPTESWSLRDIMEAEESISKNSDSKRIPVTKQPKDKECPLPSTAGSTCNDNPWQSIPEIKHSDLVPSFVEILKEEQKQSKNLVREQSKPLHLIQIEDQAIEELLKYYNAADNADERVHVMRIMSQNVSTPVWKATARTGNNKHLSK